jgi:CRISPR-associated protein Csb2
MGDAGGQAPPLTSFAHVAKAVRDFILSAWEGPIPEMVSGHAPDGSPSRAPHLAIVPLADVGAAHSDGRLMGFSLALPRQAGGMAEKQAGHAVRARLDCLAVGVSGQPLMLTSGSLGVWCVERKGPPYGFACDPSRYAGPARTWATVTPIMLDRFPKAKLSAEAIVADASRRIGLPRPCRVRLSVSAQLAGVPPSDRLGERRAGVGWLLPQRRDNSRHPLEGRLSTHAIIEYREPISGPVILGAARFLGLGLCLPVDEGSR